MSPSSAPTPASARTVSWFDDHRYDRLAFRYVSYVAIPLLIAYTGYSLVYESHRGWYSFIISTLTSFVYMFGFVRTCGISHWQSTWTHLYSPFSRRSSSLSWSSIINSRFAVGLFFLTWDWVMTGLTECGAHAYESNDIQIALYRGRWSFRVRAFHLFLWVAIMVCSFCIKMPFLHRLACFRWVWPLIDRWLLIAAA